MRLRTYIGFAVVLLGVLGVTTFANTHQQAATAWHRFITYGWPQAWLHLHTMDTTQWVNDQKIVGEHTVEGFHIDWLPCLSAVGTSAVIAAALIAPLAIMDWKGEKKHAGSR